MPVRVQLVNLAEVQQIAIEIEPLLHAARADGLRQMIDRDETGAGVAQIGLRGVDLDGTEVDVEDRDVAETAALAATAAPTVDEVDVRIADALDGRNHQFALAESFAFERPCAEFDRAVEGPLRVGHANTHRADAHAVFLGIARGERIRLGVEQEIHLALAIQRDVLADMARNRLEAELLEGLRRAPCGSRAANSTNSRPAVPSGLCSGVRYGAHRGVSEWAGRWAWQSPCTYVRRSS